MAKTCPQCKKEFEIKKYLGVTVFCSQRCQRTWAAAKRRRPVPQAWRDIDEMIAAARKPVYRNGAHYDG